MLGPSFESTKCVQVNALPNMNPALLSICATNQTPVRNFQYIYFFFLPDLRAPVHIPLHPVLPHTDTLQEGCRVCHR